MPLTALTIAATLWTTPDRRGGRRGQLDMVGLIGFVAGLGGLVFTVISVGHHADRPVIIVSAVVTVTALATALRSAARSAHPVLPLDLLRRKDFLSPNAVALTMMIFNGMLFVSTLYLQDVLGYSPLAAGLSVLPLAVPLIVLAPVSGRITAHRGPRTAIMLGCAIAVAGSLALTAVDATGGIGWLLAGFALLGCGAGLVTTSAVAAVVRATPPDRAGLATGTSNTARQIGTASGVAVFGAVACAPNGAHFVGGIHLLAVAAAVAWAVAMALAWYGVSGRPRESGRTDTSVRFPPDDQPPG